jgi:hypothetical protein
LNKKTNVNAVQGSVLYIADKANLSVTKVLQQAQDEASQANLPFAVITTVLKNELTQLEPSLLKFEAELARANVPLMLLVGEPKAVLGGLFHHLKPQHIFEDDLSSDSAVLKILPTTWPGRIITVTELVEIAQQGADCL